MTFKKEGEKSKKKTGGIHEGSSFASQGNPSHDRGEEDKEKKTRQLQIGVEKPPVLSELCSLFICHGGPDSHECTAQQQAAKKKKKNLESSERRRRGEKFCIKALRIGPSTFSAAPKRGEVGSCCADRKILN